LNTAGELGLLIRLAVALAIGLLVGLERGWHSREERERRRAAGFRTFALSGLLGGVSGAIAAATHFAVLGFLFVGYTAAFTAFHWLEAKENRDLSATSVVAGMLTFALGAYAVVGDLRVAVACAVAATLLLALREPLHRWVGSLRWEEIRAVLILLAMTFLLLPVLPNRTVDPWGSVNPAEIWLLAIMIAAISFGGYVAVRLFGDRLGVVMAAVTGGLASSTATTLTLARLGAGEPASDRLLAGGILVAGTVMVVRVGLVATLLNQALIAPLLVPLAAAAVVLAAGAALLLLRGGDGKRPKLDVANPLELGTAIKLAAMIAVVMIATNLLQRFAGGAAVLLVGAISGVADVDAVTISMARLGGSRLDIGIAVQAIALAAGVNSIAKAVMAGWVGGRRIGAYVGAVSALAVLAGGATLFAGL
jgi:uncharacterized membrane protein (DUF4010 family)